MTQAPNDQDPDIDLVLNPAARLLWRSTDSVHVELGSRSVIIDGLPAEVIAYVVSSVAPRAGRRPTLDAATRSALRTLAEDGYLWPRPADGDDPRLAPPSPRLAGELTALAARHGELAAELLNARRHYSVVVSGTGGAVAHLAALLAAAGVGRVRCVAPGTVRLLHAMPGGVLSTDEGDDLTVAGERAVLRAAPDADTTPLPADDEPHLTVLAHDGPVDDDRRAALHASRSAHLRVSVSVDHGIVGPLVVPGLTSCLRCADLHRHDRDPAWSALAAQLALPRRYGPTVDLAVATTMVGVAAQQALTFLDGGEPATIDGTLELRPPDWRLRRRSWATHPACDCHRAEPDAHHSMSPEHRHWAQ